MMTVEGSPVSPTISGTAADYTLTYNPPSDFSPGQVVNVSIDAEDLHSPANVMATDTYSFTVQNTPLTAEITATPATPGTFNPATYTFSATPSESTITAYSWNFGDGSTSTGATPQHKYTTSGNITVSLTATINGTNVQATKTIQIPAQLPKPSLN